MRGDLTLFWEIIVRLHLQQCMKFYFVSQNVMQKCDVAIKCIISVSEMDVNLKTLVSDSLYISLTCHQCSIHCEGSHVTHCAEQGEMSAADHSWRSKASKTKLPFLNIFNALHRKIVSKRPGACLSGWAFGIFSKCDINVRHAFHSANGF